MVSLHVTANAKPTASQIPAFAGMTYYNYFILKHATLPINRILKCIVGCVSRQA